ncbi:hypothetical protein AVEN_115667-1, partial [Araneus ventricosus]
MLGRHWSKVRLLPSCAQGTCSANAWQALEQSQTSTIGCS